MRYVGLQVNWAGTISAASSTVLQSGAARQLKSPKKLGPVFGQRNKLFNCVFYARATVPSPASGPARHPPPNPHSPRRGRALRQRPQVPCDKHARTRSRHHGQMLVEADRVLGLAEQLAELPL